jgi:outer membrane murein-binding lipoprotein Lpp
MRGGSTLKLKILIAAAIFIGFIAGIHSTPPKTEPDKVQQLQTEVQQIRTDMEKANQDLRAEMEDVRSVQGYIAWEMDWRNRGSKP